MYMLLFHFCDELLPDVEDLGVRPGQAERRLAAADEVNLVPNILLY